MSKVFDHIYHPNNNDRLVNFVKSGCTKIEKDNEYLELKNIEKNNDDIYFTVEYYIIDGELNGIQYNMYYSSYKNDVYFDKNILEGGSGSNDELEYVFRYFNVEIR